MLSPCFPKNLHAIITSTLACVSSFLKAPDQSTRIFSTTPQQSSLTSSSWNIKSRPNIHQLENRGIEQLIQELNKRQLAHLIPNAHEFFQLIESRSDLIQSQVDIRQLRNSNSKEIAQLIKETNADNPKVKHLQSKGIELKQKLAEITENATCTLNNLECLALSFPNIDTFDSTNHIPPDNETVQSFINPPPPSHLDVVKKLNSKIACQIDFPKGHVDFDTGQEFKDHRQLLTDFEIAQPAHQVSGPKFWYLFDEAVKLEQALIAYSMRFYDQAGFTLVRPPEMVKRGILEGCGFQARGEHSQIYHVSNTNDPVIPEIDDPQKLCLIGTSEIPLAGIHADSVLPINTQFPLRYAALSSCFRAEAGASGQKEGGLYRQHQFTKLELFSFTTPEQSQQEFKDIIKLQKAFYESFGMHYRILDMPPQELGLPAATKFDIEVYMPGGQKYGEVSSTSNCTDYQARRLNIRFKDPVSQKNKFVHTLNGTGIALPRMIIALLENYSSNSGKVQIPPVLEPYYW